MTTLASPDGRRTRAGQVRKGQQIRNGRHWHDVENVSTWMDRKPFQTRIACDDDQVVFWFNCNERVTVRNPR